jgi:hypothetical protein
MISIANLRVKLAKTPQFVFKSRISFTQFKFQSQLPKETFTVDHNSQWRRIDTLGD